MDGERGEGGDFMPIATLSPAERLGIKVGSDERDILMFH